MQHAWKVLLMMAVMALSGCAGNTGTPVETAPTTSVEDQVGEPGDVIEVDPGTAGLSVQVTPSIDQAYIPYRAAFAYEAVVVDADGAKTDTPVSVALSSDSLTLSDAATAGGAIGFLVDVAGEHAVTATFQGAGVDDVKVALDVTGLYDELAATLATGLETQMLVPHALTYEVAGGLGRDDGNFTYTCAWDAPDSFEVDGCSATVLATAPGELAFTMVATDGVSTMTVAESLTATAPQASGAVTAGYACFSNDALSYNGLIAFGTAAAGDSKPKFYAGVETIECKTRFTKGTGIDENTPAYFYILDSEGALAFEGPATSAVDHDATGAADGYVYTGAAWEIPEDQPEGEYALLIRLQMPDGSYDWIQHNQSNAADSGAALIDVVAPPA